MNTDVNYEKMQAVELEMAIKKLSRGITKLENQKKHINPNTAAHFVELAKIESDLEVMKEDRLQIGKVMLKLDEERKQRQVDSLQGLKRRGVEITGEILDKLPAFSQLVHDAFIVIEGDFAELQLLSKELRSVNMCLLNNRENSLVTGANLIEPAGLNRLLKQELLRVFGEGFATYRAQKVEGDIRQAVEIIKQKVQRHG